MPKEWREAEVWRKVVEHQPVTMLCKDAIIDDILSSDWSIEPKISDQREELKSEIDYYTDLFTYTGDYHYEEIVEWVGEDYLDISFGGAVEKGYMNDDPNDRLVWIKPIDGGTMFPTLNDTWRYGQRLKENFLNPVFFPKHAISRIYMSPRTRIKDEGWGKAPPEKIFLAIEMLRRGDLYYANLLLDTPEAGVLDLGNISEEAAIAWLDGWKKLMAGIDPLKVPLLYESEGNSKFISFGRPPTEMMYGEITTKYAAFVAAGYGLSLSDIGLQVSSSGGETLAGSIRQERRSKRSGKARAKKKFIAFWNSMLPDDLYFNYIDFDDELQVAKGRAFLSITTSLNQAIEKRYITPQESRLVLLADGYLPSSFPETIPEDGFEDLDDSKMNNQVGLLGNPVPPSQGGQGEIRESQIIQRSLVDTRGTLGEQVLKYLTEDTPVEMVWSAEEYKKLYDTHDNIQELMLSLNTKVGELSSLYINDIVNKLLDVSGLDINEALEDNMWVDEIASILKGEFPIIENEILKDWQEKSKDYRRSIKDGDNRKEN
jgi:hypothetical protein